MAAVVLSATTPRVCMALRTMLEVRLVRAALEIRPWRMVVGWRAERMIEL
jgi:hypothetical protein